jgi:hypothetical protein
MVRMSVCQGDYGDLTRRSIDLLHIVLEKRGHSPNPRIDQTDVLTQEDIRIDKPVHIIVLAEGQPELVLKGMNGLCDFHPRFFLSMALGL